MNSLHLKIIAIITMLIDHIGLFIFPEIKIFRIIGRISFPIFAYLLINTYDYTNNFWKKENKLWWMAVITQMIFYILNIDKINVFVSLWLSFRILDCIEWKKTKNLILFIIIILLGVIIGNNISVLYEVSFIVLFYKLRNTLKFEKRLKYFIGLISIVYIISYMNTEPLYLKSFYSTFTLIGMLIPEIFYNGKYGNKKIHQILWYVYPIHFIILHFISKII